MKRIKVKKRYLAGTAALMLVIAGMNIPAMYAADAIDIDRDCTLTLNVADTGEYAEDLATAEIAVSLYRVASVERTGAYTSTSDFQELKIEDLESGEEDWEAVADEAEKIIEEDEIAPDETFEIVDGVGTKENLDTGIYLVVAEDTNTEMYTYSFNSYMIALPDNLYYQSGDAADDEWLYDVTGSLKPEQSPRYGSLKIIKTLTEFNATLRETTFVFQVEGVDDEGNTVYSNVASTTHSAAGTKEAVLEDIPAGAHLTVTEVYSGASYTLTSDEIQTTTIVAEQVMEVSFTNTYNEELTPGYGVTNHFDYDEDDGWQWSRLTDNSTAQE